MVPYDFLPKVLLLKKYINKSVKQSKVITSFDYEKLLEVFHHQFN